MANQMTRAVLGATAKSTVLSTPAATYGVCLPTEFALFIGANVPNRMAIGVTVLNALFKALEYYARKVKPAAPGAGSLLYISLDMVTSGPKGIPTVAVVAGATAPNDNTIGILIGNTLYGSVQRSETLESLFEVCINSPAASRVRKKG
jgi:hypothetical protein